MPSHSPSECRSEDHGWQSWGHSRTSESPQDTVEQKASSSASPQPRIPREPQDSVWGIGHAPSSWPYLVVLYQDVPGGIEDLRVQCVCVLGQRVVVVKAVDFDVAQADLIVGIDGCWV